jgi:hypothetical protein
MNSFQIDDRVAYRTDADKLSPSSISEQCWIVVEKKADKLIVSQHDKKREAYPSELLNKQEVEQALKEAEQLVRQYYGI